MSLAGPSTAPATAREMLFDSEFLRKLESLELLAKKIFRGLLRGEHRAPRRGIGLEFSDFRRYQPGDDFRYIDWNIYSRLDRLFLKLYTAEEDITLHLLLDTSASMGFGDPVKFDYARRVAAALAYIGMHNLDRVGLTAFTGGLGATLPPLKAKHHLPALLSFLVGLPCAEVTDFGLALREFALSNRRPGLVVLISDLLGGAELKEGLRALRSQRHDVVVVQLLAEDEIEPPLAGALRLVDAEEGREMRVTVDAELRELYRGRLDAFLEDLEGYCLRSKIEYLRASTAIPFEDLVLKYLRQGTYFR